MKQTTQSPKRVKPEKLLKRCPYEYYTFSCERCLEYKKCMAKKQEQQEKIKRQQLQEQKIQEQKRLQQQKLQQWQKLKKRLLAVLLGVLFLTSIIFVILYTDAKKEIISLRETIAELETSVSTQLIDNAPTSMEEQQIAVSETEGIAEEQQIAVSETEGIAEEQQIAVAKTEVAELSAYAPSNTYYYNIAYEDKVEMAKVVYAEAGAECFEGKVGVAAVILNRFFDSTNSFFDKTSIYSIIHQPYQFATIKHITDAHLEEIPDCMEAVEAACKGWDPTRKLFPEGALYFYAPSGVRGKEAEIRDGIEFLAIGNHNFHVNFDKVS